MKSDHPNGRPAANAPDLSDTIRQLRNQTPQESLGLPAGTGLVKPFIQATAAVAVALAALTVIPYFIDKGQPATAQPAPAADDTPAPSDRPPAAPNSPAAPATPGPEASAKQPPSPAGIGKPPPGKDDILNKLGENGSKTASPKVNPLDKKDDDLLKDLK